MLFDMAMATGDRIIIKEGTNITGKPTPSFNAIMVNQDKWKDIPDSIFLHPSMAGYRALAIQCLRHFALPDSTLYPLITRGDTID